MTLASRGQGRLGKGSVRPQNPLKRAEVNRAHLLACAFEVDRGIAIGKKMNFHAIIRNNELRMRIFQKAACAALKTANGGSAARSDGRSPDHGRRNGSLDRVALEGTGLGAQSVQ